MSTRHLNFKFDLKYLLLWQGIYNFWDLKFDLNIWGADRSLQSSFTQGTNKLFLIFLIFISEALFPSLK